MNVNKSQPSHYLSMNGLVFDVLPLHVKVLLIYAFLCIDNTKKVITVFLFSVYNYLIKVLFTHLNLPTWKYIKECLIQNEVHFHVSPTLIKYKEYWWTDDEAEYSKAYCEYMQSQLNEQISQI